MGLWQIRGVTSCGIFCLSCVIHNWLHSLDFASCVTVPFGLLFLSWLYLNIYIHSLYVFLFIQFTIAVERATIEKTRSQTANSRPPSDDATGCIPVTGARKNFHHDDTETAVCTEQISETKMKIRPRGCCLLRSTCKYIYR